MVHVVPLIATHDIIVHEQSSTQWLEHSPCENHLIMKSHQVAHCWSIFLSWTHVIYK